MTPGEKALSDAQEVLAPMMVKHQQQMNALAIREATARAEAAEWMAQRERACFEACTNEWRRMGIWERRTS